MRGLVGELPEKRVVRGVVWLFTEAAFYVVGGGGVGSDLSA